MVNRKGGFLELMGLRTSIKDSFGFIGEGRTSALGSFGC